MKKLFTLIVASCLFSFFMATSDSSSEYDKNWPQWRGPHASGVAPYGDPPTEWSEEKNIRWKISIPGKGLAAPIIWDDKVFILTAIETDMTVVKEQVKEEAPPQGRRGRGGRGRRRVQPTHVVEYTILAINRKDGNIVWQHTPRKEVPHEGTHGTASWASNSPITDGEHVFAYFGSHGLYCYDMDGNLQWETDPGNMRTRNSFGEGSSPALYKETIVLNWDHEGDSFIVAYHKNNGEELWKIDRDEPTSWSTPLIVEHDGKAQVIVSATKRVRGYDLTTGEVIWECGGMTVNSIPSPVYHDGIVYVTSGFRGSAMLAIRLADAKGDITGSEAIVWRHDKDTPYTPSPVLYKNSLYFTKVNTEILSSFNAKTGQPNYGQQRLAGIKGMYASPVAANGRVYFAGRNGVTVVVKHGSDFEVLATNTLDDGFDASPAIVGNELYLRGLKNLYCIAQE